MSPSKYTVDDVRAAGGIVHKDGNIFFTNIDKLNQLPVAAGQQVARAIDDIQELVAVQDKVSKLEVYLASLAFKAMPVAVREATRRKYMTLLIYRDIVAEIVNSI